MDERSSSGRDPARARRLAARGVSVFRVVAAFDLALGLLILGYAALQEPTFRLARGGLILGAIGVLGLVAAARWRRKLESMPA